jgi:hypothetical protein
VQAQPEQGRKLRVGQVRFKVTRNVEKRFLDDVRGVEAGPEAGVHAQFDHPPEPLAVPLEEGRQSPATVAAKRFEWVVGAIGRVVHDYPHTLYLRAGERARPKKSDRRGEMKTRRVRDDSRTREAG